MRVGSDLRTPPRAAKTPRSTWRGRVKSGRRVVVRPSGLIAGALLVATVLMCLAVIGYGVVTFSPFWSVCAGLAGAAVLAVTLRGFPLFAIAPVVVAAFLWGLATRPWLPDDFLGVFKFLGGNLAFDVPLVVAYLAAILVDSRRLSRLAIDEAVSGRRWWVEGTDRPSGPPPLRELEMIPSTRFFVLDQGPCSHLVVAGRHVALLMSATWKPGAITMDPDGQVLRSGQPYGQGTDDLDALAGEVRLWRERLDGTGARVRGFLVVAPTSDELAVDVLPGEQLALVPAYAFSDTVGGWLATQPYRIELAVMERLLRTAMPEFASDRAVAPEYGSGYGGLRRRSRRSAPVVAPSAAAAPSAPAPSARASSQEIPPETSPEVEEDWAYFSAWHEPSSPDAPAWDSDSARRLAEWAADEAPIPGPAPAALSKPEPQQVPSEPEVEHPAASAGSRFDSPLGLPPAEPAQSMAAPSQSLLGPSDSFDWPGTRPTEPSAEPLEFRNWPTIKPVPPASLAPFQFTPEPDWPSEPDEEPVEEAPAEADDVVEPPFEPEQPPEPEPEPRTRSWRSRLRRAFEPVREPDSPGEPEPDEPQFDAFTPRASADADTPKFRAPMFDDPRFDDLRSEPDADTPRFQAPMFDDPRFDDLRSKPGADTPRFEAPMFDDPRFDGLRAEPDADTPRFELPALEESPSRLDALRSEPDAETPRFEEPTFEEPTFEEPTFEEPALEEPALEEPPAEVEAPSWSPYQLEAAPSAEEAAADTPRFQAPALDESPSWSPSRYDALRAYDEPEAEPQSFASHPWPVPNDDLAPPALPTIPAEPEPEPESRRSRRKKEPEPAPPEREPRGWRSRRKRDAEPTPPPTTEPAEAASDDPRQSRLWQAARALDPAPIDPILNSLEPRRPSRHSSEPDPVADQPDVPQADAPPEDRPSRFAPELSDRPSRFGLDRFPPPPEEAGPFGSEPERPEPIERPALPDRLGAAGLFGSEPDRTPPAERPGLFGVDADPTAPEERRDQPDERFNRFRRFRPEPEPEPIESPSAYQPPDRSDRYADERPGQEPTPGQVDFGRLRKFGRADEEAGSHRAEAAPEWATSNTWDDQQEPEKRKGRRARKAEPEPEQPQPQQWPAEQATESQPAEKKSRRQQRRERKTRPDETEEWLSGLSSSEPMSWEARQGRTTPNDGLGLTEDMADFKRQPSRQRGSLFEDNGDETWNSPPPATDGDDWWEATPRRRRDGKDS